MTTTPATGVLGCAVGTAGVLVDGGDPAVGELGAGCVGPGVVDIPAGGVGLGGGSSVVVGGDIVLGESGLLVLPPPDVGVGGSLGGGVVDVGGGSGVLPPPSSPSTGLPPSPAAPSSNLNGTSHIWANFGRTFS